jgi:hypothetical protein
LDTTASVFFNKVKALSDTLASIGHPLRPDEFQNYLLDGLDEDYDNLVETIKRRDDPMSAQDLYARLCSTEQRMAGDWLYILMCQLGAHML